MILQIVKELEAKTIFVQCEHGQITPMGSGVDKAAYCVCTRKFSASTLENLS